MWHCELLTQPGSARAGFAPGSFETNAASVVPVVCFVLPGWSWQLLGLGSSKPLWKLFISLQHLPPAGEIPTPAHGAGVFFGSHRRLSSVGAALFLL